MSASKTAITQGVIASAIVLLMSGCGGDGKSTSSSSSVALSSAVSSAAVSSSSSMAPISSSASSLSSISSSSSVSSASSSVVKTERLVLAINVGSSEKVNYNGVEYQPDRFGTGGTQNSVTGDIKGVEEDTLFQSEKYGTQTYSVPVTNANYRVVLHFAELYQTAAGKRLFNASVEGQSVFSNMDLFTLVGAKGAYTPPDVNITVSDESLTIALETLADNATLSGFAIYSIDGEFVEPPPPPPPPPLEPIPPGTVSAENAGADCVVPVLPAIADLPVIAKLPDPFTKIEGGQITKKEDWRCRRQEILRQAENYIYGFKPSKPEVVTGTVTNDKITVNVTHNGKSTTFSASIKLPSAGAAPYPALVGFGNFGLAVDSAIVDSEGIAIISYDPYAVGAESGGSRSVKKGAFYDIYGSDSKTGLLAAWSWGVSRIIDVIEQANADGSLILDSTYTGVTGCSRFGKGAFTVGVMDQRIALTMPLESGTGGVPAWRLLSGEGAQSASSAYGETYWLGDEFSPFTSSVTKLPVDTHEMIALVAPRGLFIMDNPHIANLGPKAAHTAALAGQEVYKALGAESNITYHSNVASGSHCAIRAEFADPLRQNLRKFMRGQSGITTGGISASANAQGNLEQWRDWTTPTLQ
jgi:hypothetical protein